MRPLPTAKKLITALRQKGIRLTLSTKQFYGREGEPHNFYSISRAEWDNEKEKYLHTELYSTVSAIRIVLYLRDMWYQANGWELPDDQEQWNNIRTGFKEDNNG